MPAYQGSTASQKVRPASPGTPPVDGAVLAEVEVAVRRPLTGEAVEHLTGTGGVRGRGLPRLVDPDRLPCLRVQQLLVRSDRQIPWEDRLRTAVPVPEAGVGAGVPGDAAAERGDAQVDETARDRPPGDLGGTDRVGLEVAVAEPPRSGARGRPRQRHGHRRGHPQHGGQTATDHGALLGLAVHPVRTCGSRTLEPHQPPDLHTHPRRGARGTHGPDEAAGPRGLSR